MKIEREVRKMYRHMYLCLFRAITDALEQIEARNYGLTEQRLKDAQCEAERLYIEGGRAKKSDTAVTIFTARHNME